MSTVLARRWVDVVIVLIAVAAQVEVWSDPAQTPRLATAPAALLWTLPLLLRRRLPMGAPIIVFATLAAESLLSGMVVGESQVNAPAIVAAFCVAGTHPNQRRALGAGAIGYVALAVVVLNDVPRIQGAVGVFLLCAAGWTIGRSLAERSRRALELEARAADLERRHEVAVLAERARIASELHDVIAHSVSVMAIQAGAARVLLDQDPERAREPLAAVEETGHQALAEMRRLLGVLRGSEDEAELTPQPGLAQLDALVAQVRSAGLPVDVETEGQARELPAGVDLTAFRVIQEALTNVRKHAGAARAHVRLRYEPAMLELEVVDSGRARAHASSGGYGLVGMRQRVALYGGELEAGPRAQGGFRVRARLPLAGGAA